MTHAQYENEYEMEGSKQWSRFLANKQLHLAEQRICGKAAQEHDAPYTDHDESHYNLQESLIASSADRKEGRRLLPVLILYQYCEYPVGMAFTPCRLVFGILPAPSLQSTSSLLRNLSTCCVIR